jgi:hypothetical protein
MGLIEWSKLTLKGRYKPDRPQSAIPFVNRSRLDDISVENTPQKKSNKLPAYPDPYNIPQDGSPSAQTSSSQLHETVSIFKKLQESKSSKALQLPQIPHLKPMTMNSLFVPDERNLEGKCLYMKKRIITCSRTNLFSFVEESLLCNKPITRKAVPTKSYSASTSPYSHHCLGPQFDPGEPLWNADMHVAAKLALKRRYQSKLTVDFQVPEGLSVRDYDFRWVDEEDLDRKVLHDIVWVRERYAQIGKGEPSDEDIIWWYDAEGFLDDGSGVGIAL